jgi:N-methylhydantoinase B
MLSASPKYAREATAIWQGSNLCIHLFGRNYRNQEVIGSTTDTFAGSGGARWTSDGIDLGGEIPNPISRMANVETNEAMYPVRYLFRRRLRDSGGAGLFRGGTGGEYAMTPHDSPIGEMGFVVSGKGVEFPMSHGLRGGYPGAPARYVVCRDAQDKAKRSTALSLDEIGGTQEPSSFGVYHVYENDIFYVNWNGAGGVRDPLDRDPALVARVVVEVVVSSPSARNLYGVVVTSEGALNTTETESLRQHMRNQRKHLPGPAIKGSNSHVCDRCGVRHGLDAIKVRERRLSDIDGSYTTGSAAVLAEMVCVQCTSLLDAEVTKQGVSALFDGASVQAAE